MLIFIWLATLNPYELGYEMIVTFWQLYLLTSLIGQQIISFCLHKDKRVIRTQ